jgi:hypothetical protein
MGIAERMVAPGLVTRRDKNPPIGGFLELLAADVAAVLATAQASHTTSCSGTLHGKGLIEGGMMADTSADAMRNGGYRWTRTKRLTY